MEIQGARGRRRERTCANVDDSRTRGCALFLAAQARGGTPRERVRQADQVSFFSLLFLSVFFSLLCLSLRRRRDERACEIFQKRTQVARFRAAPRATSSTWNASAPTRQFWRRLCARVTLSLSLSRKNATASRARDSESVLQFLPGIAPTWCFRKRESARSSLAGRARSRRCSQVTSAVTSVEIVGALS